MGRLAIGPGRPDEAWHCFGDLAELIFAVPQCLLSVLERREARLFFGLVALIIVDSHLPPASFVHRTSGVAAPMANAFALDRLRQAMLSQKILENHGSSTRRSSNAAPSVSSGVELPTRFRQTRPY